MQTGLLMTNNPWPIIIGVVGSIILIVMALIVFGIMKLRQNKPKMRKFIDAGVVVFFFLCGIFVWASLATKTQQVTITDAICNSGSQIFPGIVKVKNVDGDLSTLLFPIAGYEGSHINVFDAEGKIIDTWYSSDFCNADQTFGERVKDTYDSTQLISVTTNYFGRIRSWQFVD